MGIYRIYRRIRNVAAIITVAAAGIVTIGKVTINGGMTSHSTKTTKTAQYIDPCKEYNEIGLPIMSKKSLLLVRKDYVTSYNEETKTPYWVQWHLTRERASGTIKRPDYAFHEDLEVPPPRADIFDYRASGYDRGHMCPAGDNKHDEESMYESFLLTNICPQNRQLNSGLWNDIEMQCRVWAKKYGSLYIVTGPIYLQTEHKTIGKNQIVVPEAFFKAIICLEPTPKGIAFVCRNTDGKRKKDFYVNTIEEVERITGITLFPNLDIKTANEVKKKADLKSW